MPDTPPLAPLPPSNHPHTSIADVQEHFAAVTAKTPVDYSFRDAFVQSKLMLAHTHPALDVASRDVAVQGLAQRLGAEALNSFSRLSQPSLQETAQPVPGGVGYGFFYDATFKTAWGHGTALAFDIVCPTPPDGNVNTW